MFHINLIFNTGILRHIWLYLLFWIIQWILLEKPHTKTFMYSQWSPSPTTETQAESSWPWKTLNSPQVVPFWAVQSRAGENKMRHSLHEEKDHNSSVLDLMVPDTHHSSSMTHMPAAIVVDPEAHSLFIHYYIVYWLIH